MTIVDDLRTAVHAAIDRTFDEILGEGDALESDVSSGGQGIVVLPTDVTGAWTYRWPGGDVEEFSKTRWYDADGPRGRQRVRVAWTTRSAWGRSDRKRAVVFNQVGSADTTYYPWTEFVETDDGRYAAPIPDPERPRATIANRERLPERFEDCAVERSDALFRSVNDGPSLRLVVGADEEAAMVDHGYWVATMRRRI
jgi:hypothetical protein